MCIYGTHYAVLHNKSSSPSLGLLTTQLVLCRHFLSVMMSTPSLQSVSTLYMPLSFHYQWPLKRFSTFCQHSKSTSTVFLVYISLFHHQHCNVSTLSVLQYIFSQPFLLYELSFQSVKCFFWYVFLNTQ